MDLCFDLETLGTDPDAVVLSIGAVLFDYDRGVTGRFYMVLDRTWQMQHRSVTADTLDWWMEQSQEARDAIWKAKQVFEPAYALQALQHFVPADVRFAWCRGLNFDDPIMAHLYKQLGHEKPWKFFQGRDSRTVLDDVGGAPLPTRSGIHHQALDDAEYEAQRLIAVLNHRREQSRTLKLFMPADGQFPPAFWDMARANLSPEAFETMFNGRPPMTVEDPDQQLSLFSTGKQAFDLSTLDALPKNSLHS
jgi:hypothetical protein